MKLRTVLLLVFLSANLFSQNDMDAEMFEAKAQELAHKFIIADGHVDLPYRLKIKNFQLTKEFIGIPIETDDGDFDFVRAKKGGLSAPFMSIYIPSKFQVEGGAKIVADSLIDMVNGIIAAHPDHFGKGLSPAQVEANFKAGKISLPMGMENGAPVLELSDVAYFQKEAYAILRLPIQRTIKFAIRRMINPEHGMD